MFVEFEACLVIVTARCVVVERPDTTWLMDQMANWRRFVGPDAFDATPIPILPPLFGIEMSIIIERSDKLVATVSTAVGKIWVSGEFQANMLQRHWRTSQ
ncbi:protein of unknown function [Candidatus Filomicrobium marinum]|uniref:Uncharacterized protein n=1 Tax=Candidatus Filomicrobium marinum TaxID=1608628 RepID=A0A0D6JEZ2_9HYPH|nr:protein of unknown function [Candidatus Filomicrobium marinum]CPR18793.1 protein of unknown function [Candidatus Filomicrobium marinum]